jgi:hypothetical protein
VLSPSERLSEQELQRRHTVVRKKMQERGLDLIVVSGVRFVGATGYLRYLTNWAESLSFFLAKGHRFSVHALLSVLTS